MSLSGGSGSSGSVIVKYEIDGFESSASSTKLVLTDTSFTSYVPFTAPQVSTTNLDLENLSVQNQVSCQDVLVGIENDGPVFIKMRSENNLYDVKFTAKNGDAMNEGDGDLEIDCGKFHVNSNGSIELNAPTEIVLNTPSVVYNGNLDITDLQAESATIGTLNTTSSLNTTANISGNALNLGTQLGYTKIDFKSNNSLFDARIECQNGSPSQTGRGELTLTTKKLLANISENCILRLNDLTLETPSTGPSNYPGLYFVGSSAETSNGPAIYFKQYPTRPGGVNSIIRSTGDNGDSGHIDFFTSLNDPNTTPELRVRIMNSGRFLVGTTDYETDKIMKVSGRARIDQLVAGVGTGQEVEIKADSTDTSYIDFHSLTNVDNDFDSRIISRSGVQNQNGKADMSFEANSFSFSSNIYTTQNVFAELNKKLATEAYVQSLVTGENQFKTGRFIYKYPSGEPYFGTPGGIHDSSSFVVKIGTVPNSQWVRRTVNGESVVKGWNTNVSCLTYPYAEILTSSGYRMLSESSNSTINQLDLRIYKDMYQPTILIGSDNSVGSYAPNRTLTNNWIICSNLKGFNSNTTTMICDIQIKFYMNNPNSGQIAGTMNINDPLPPTLVQTGPTSFDQVYYTDYFPILSL